MKSVCTLIIYTFSLFTPSLQYYFGLNWGACQHICTDKAKNSKIEGYYWKDFDGSIPSDAWLAGQSKDNANLYVGQVYDPDNHGVFIVTIYGKQSFVRNTLTAQSKLTKYIQILCTQEPEKMKFIYADKANYSAIGSSVLTGGKKQFQHNGQSLIYHMSVAKDVATNLIGGVSTYANGVEFTLPSGEKKNSLKYMFLTFGFESKEAPDSSLSMQARKTFFAHKIHVAPNKASIVPNFYTEIKYGSCCSTCTNMMSTPDTMYYWRDKKGADIMSDALIAGHTSNGKNLILVQAYHYGHNLFFTSANYSLKSANFIKEGSNQFDIISDDLKVFSSSNDDTLEWIPVNATTANSYKKAAIIGSAEATGRIAYIGRFATKKNEVFPGLVYLDGKPRLIPGYIDANNEPVYDFEMLIFKGKKPLLSGSSFLDTLLSFFRFNIVLEPNT